MVRRRSHSEAAREREAKRYPRKERRARMELAHNLHAQGNSWRDVGKAMHISEERARVLGLQFQKVLRYEDRTGTRWDEVSLRERVAEVRNAAKIDRAVQALMSEEVPA